MPDYTDHSYPPVGPELRYTRGDGAIVTLKIEHPQAAVAAPLPVIRNAPPAPQSLPPTPVPTARHMARPLVSPPVNLSEHNVFDDPAVGGKLTVFVLLSLNYPEMHKRCLDAIISTAPAGRIDLRVGSNELCATSVAYVQSLMDQGLVSCHYQHITNDAKYPVMREMFHDPANPIETKWLLWFDDDSIADREPQWLTILARAMIQHPDAAMFGAKFLWTMQRGQADTYRSRPWYRGKPFRDRSGRPSPNGNTVLFATGGFWALTTEAMRACDIPDPLLHHNGGDYTIGEQLWQGGFTLKAWNGQKQYIHTSAAKRRGISETHFGVVRG